ncbi:MAG: hypothetical protein BZY88_06175 [SAR202 cluster bacterium Io17-Chloro-G9]|nr:MAG: hypothetical protein BZY88_06175 [SAR202 cluster bacterium Io17-Chloro-G9]
MDLTFERGDPQRPKGHALVYFRVNTEPDKVYATYVIALPVKADLTKYVPPFLASHLGSMPLSDFSAFAMPPVPEPVVSHEELERLSREREDDLVFAISMFSFDLPRMMESVAEVVEAYSQLCANRLGATTTTATELPAPDQRAASSTEDDDDQSLRVDEVLFSLMSEGDKLGELSRLLGKLRFAVEGQDSGMTEEAGEEISTLARHLPEDFQVPALLAVAMDTSAKSSRLAQLYLDRCFRLSAGDLNSAQALAEEIQNLQAQD